MPTLKEIDPSSLLPIPKERKENRTTRENQYCEIWHSTVSTIPKNDSSSPPSDWLEAISPDNAIKDISNVEHYLSSAPACISDSHELVRLFNSCGGNQVIATIASGNKSKVQLLHNMDQVGTSTVALHGFGTLASPQLIDTGRLLDTKHSLVPDVETIANIPPRDRSSHQVPSSNLSMVPISNSIILPSKFAHDLVTNNFDGSPDTLLTSLLAFLQDEDDSKQIVTFVLAQDTNESEESEDEIEERDEIPMSINPNSALITYSHTIQSMYKWATQPRATQNCSSPTDDESISRWTALCHDILAIKKPARDSDLHLNLRPRSPSKANPNIVLTGGRIRENNIRTSLESQFNNENGSELTSTPPGTHRRNSIPPVTDQTQTSRPDGDSPFTPTTDQPQNNGNAPYEKFMEALTCLMNSTEKSTSTNERMVEAQEALVKLKEKSDKNKISDPTKEYLKNIFTTDGENKLTEVPPKLASMMTTNVETLAANLDLELHSNKTPANPSINFIKAVHKGSYHHPTGRPDNLSPLMIPYSLISASNENMDTQSLLAAEERNSDLSSEEKAAIVTNNKLTPPRTLAFSIKMMNGYTTVLKLGGEDSLLYLSTKDFADWLVEHEEVLGEITATYDIKLPTKILFSVGDALNSFFKEGRYSVPSQHWLDFESLKRNLLANQYTINLPPSVTQAFDGKKRGRDEKNSKDNSRDNKRTVVQHQNQPIQLKTTKETHNSKITPYIRSDNVSIPKNNNEEECLRWCYLGYCNSNCLRKGNHVPVKNGSTRCKKLVDFKKKAISHGNNANNNNNNNNGEQNLE